MVYLVVQEESLVELLRLPKRTIVERLVHILQSCDHVESESDDDEEDAQSNRSDCVVADGSSGGKTKSDTSLELVK